MSDPHSDAPGLRAGSRRSDEIGRGLEAARPARPIRPGERIHVLGASGAAAAGAMLLAAAAGAEVSGCDAGGPGQYTRALVAAGLPLAWGHDPAHVVRDGRPLVDRIAVSKAVTAVAPDLPELVAARAAGIPAEGPQQLIADTAATRGARLIGVAGTHGKSTTTGWVVHLLAGAGLDPSAFVGALLPGELVGGRPSVVRLGAGPYFVVEADEYAGNFDPYRPAIAVVLNADWDHPDVFADRAAVVGVFEGWLRRAASASLPGGAAVPAEPTPPQLVANLGDAGVRELVERLADWPGRLLAVEVVAPDDPAGPPLGDRAAGAAAGDRRPQAHLTRLTQLRTGLGPAEALVATYLEDPAGRPRLRLFGTAWPDGSRAVTLGLFGRHNADDALGAAGAALCAGAPPEAVLEGLTSYPGVGRRLEIKGDVGGVVVLDDYGHHPRAIAATIAAVRARYPGRRLWAVYEPLTYHRTAAMLDAFAAVLAEAERVAIAEIHAGRDPDTSIASATGLAAAVAARGTPTLAPGPVEATADALADAVAPGDVVLVMGGGRSYVIAERLVAHLRAREG